MRKTSTCCPIVRKDGGASAYRSMQQHRGFPLEGTAETPGPLRRHRDHGRQSAARDDHFANRRSRHSRLAGEHRPVQHTDKGLRQGLYGSFALLIYVDCCPARKQRSVPGGRVRRDQFPHRLSRRFVRLSEHWMRTDHVGFGFETLTADFNAHSYGERVETGYRLGWPVFARHPLCGSEGASLPNTFLQRNRSSARKASRLLSRRSHSGICAGKRARNRPPALGASSTVILQCRALSGYRVMTSSSKALSNSLLSRAVVVGACQTLRRSAPSARLP